MTTTPNCRAKLQRRLQHQKPQLHRIHSFEHFAKYQSSHATSFPQGSAAEAVAFKSAAPSLWAGGKRRAGTLLRFLRNLIPKLYRAPPPPPTFSLTLVLASKVAFFLIFGPLFSFPKKHLNFGSAQNAQKSQKSDLRSFLALFLIVFWTPFGINFSIFSDSPKTSILQQVPSETLIFIS
jgi:hypothetical protein